MYCYNRRASNSTKKYKKDKKVYRIPKVSKKLKNLQSDYAKVRAEYLREYPCCQVNLPGCSGCDPRLLSIHHRKGRIGKLLIDKDFFLTTCYQCHQFIEKNPEIAYANGWSLSRLEET